MPRGASTGLEPKLERREIRGLVEDLRRLAGSYSFEDLRDGTWLADFVGVTLDDHTAEVNASYFQRRYAGLTTEEMATRRLERARRRAAIGAGLLAGAYTAAVAAAIASGGAAAAVALPAGAAAFVADVLFSARVQLLLAYDLSVIYGRPVRLDDREELLELVQVAFGIVPGPTEAAGVGRLDAAVQQAGAAARNASDGTRRALSFVGRRLLRQAVVRATLPAASIPLSLGLSYFSAGKTGRLARKVYRDSARVEDLARRLAPTAVDGAQLVLEAIWLVVRADAEVSAEESRVLRTLARELDAAGVEGAHALDWPVRVDEADVLRRIEGSPQGRRERIYAAALAGAKVDGELGRRERGMLRELASACGVEFRVD